MILKKGLKEKKNIVLKYILYGLLNLNFFFINNNNIFNDFFNKI